MHRQEDESKGPLDVSFSALVPKTKRETQARQTNACDHDQVHAKRREQHAGRSYYNSAAAEMQRLRAQIRGVLYEVAVTD